VAAQRTAKGITAGDACQLSRCAFAHQAGTAVAAAGVLWVLQGVACLLLHSTFCSISVGLCHLLTCTGMPRCMQQQRQQVGNVCSHVLSHVWLVGCGWPSGNCVQLQLLGCWGLFMGLFVSPRQHVASCCLVPVPLQPRLCSTSCACWAHLLPGTCSGTCRAQCWGCREGLGRMACCGSWSCWVVVCCDTDCCCDCNAVAAELFSLDASPMCHRYVGDGVCCGCRMLCAPSRSGLRLMCCDAPCSAQLYTSVLSLVQDWACQQAWPC
jgi:hypothetical protein